MSKYHKGADVLTVGRAAQAAKDFADFGLSAGMAGQSGQSIVVRERAITQNYGMPNRHCPGSVAFSVLGGGVIRPGALV